MDAQLCEGAYHYIVALAVSSVAQQCSDVSGRVFIPVHTLGSNAAILEYTPNSEM